jgi:hypothetical protein
VKEGRLAVQALILEGQFPGLLILQLEESVRRCAELARGMSQETSRSPENLSARCRVRWGGRTSHGRLNRACTI